MRHYRSFRRKVTGVNRVSSIDNPLRSCGYFTSQKLLVNTKFKRHPREGGGLVTLYYRLVVDSRLRGNDGLS